MSREKSRGLKVYIDMIQTSCLNKQLSFHMHSMYTLDQYAHFYKQQNRTKPRYTLVTIAPTNKVIITVNTNSNAKLNNQH